MPMGNGWPFGVRRWGNLSQSERKSLVGMHYEWTVFLAIKLFGKSQAHELANDSNVGFEKAAERYDPTLGKPFRTFAFKYVVGAIIDAVKKNSILFHFRGVPFYKGLIESEAKKIGNIGASLPETIARSLIETNRHTIEKKGYRIDEDDPYYIRDFKKLVEFIEDNLFLSIEDQQGLLGLGSIESKTPEDFFIEKEEVAKEWQKKIECIINNEKREDILKKCLDRLEGPRKRAFQLYESFCQQETVTKFTAYCREKLGTNEDINIDTITRTFRRATTVLKKCLEENGIYDWCAVLEEPKN